MDLYFPAKRYNQQTVNFFLFYDARTKHTAVAVVKQRVSFFRSPNKLKSASLNRDISLLARQDLSPTGSARAHAISRRLFGAIL